MKSSVIIYQPRLTGLARSSCNVPSLLLWWSGLVFMVLSCCVHAATASDLLDRDSMLRGVVIRAGGGERIFQQQGSNELVKRRNMKKDDKDSGACLMITTGDELAVAIAAAHSAQSKKSRTVTICQGTTIIEVSALIVLQLTNPVTIQCLVPHQCEVTPDMTTGYEGGFIELRSGSLSVIGIDFSNFRDRVFTGSSANLALTNCDFQSNAGGAIAVASSSTLDIKSCLFFMNGIDGEDPLSDVVTAIRGGAIIAIEQSEVRISKSTFSSNSAVNEGGAVYVSGGTSFSVSQTQFLSNQVIGAVRRLSEENTLIQNNTAAAESDSTLVSGALGGAVFIEDADAKVTFSDVTFQDNFAAVAGGAFYVINSKVKLEKGCMFDSNSAVFYGGAIFVDENANLEKVKPQMFVDNVVVDDEIGACKDVWYLQGDTALCFPA